MRSLFYLNRYFWKYRWRFGLGILFITVTNVFAIYPATVIRQSLDAVLENASVIQLLEGYPAESLFRADLAKVVLIFAAVILALALLKGIFLFFQRQTIIVMSRLIEYDMKNEIYAHYQKLHLGFYRQNNTGDLMNRISEDVSRVRMYLGPAVMYTINLVVLFVMIIWIMLMVNVKLTLFVLLPLPALSIAVYLVNSTILRKSERVQQQLSRLSTFVQESFSGIRIIKAYNRIRYFTNQFAKDSETYRDKNVDLARFNAVFFPLIMLLIGFSTILSIYIGGMEVENGSITPGVIAEFIIYVNMLTWPVASMGWVTSIIQRAAASQNRILEFLHTQPEIYSATEDTGPIAGYISFKNVSFTYPETGIEALKNINLEIEPGKTLGIIGRTGSGKTTLIQLMTRFFDASAGSVYIDGKPIRDINLNQLRKDTGYVPQEVFLFSDSIRNNIAFGIHEENIPAEEEMARIEQAAKDASVYENIQGFSMQFETLVGERGITLSGGQKQRISIARAIIKRPSILLFDDCMSAVDTETEERILGNLLRIMKGRTSVLVSHRISTVKHAHHIIVMDEGSIVEQGTHEDLLEQKGLYYETYQKQLREEVSPRN